MRDFSQKTFKFETFQQLPNFIFALKFERNFELSKKTKTLKFDRNWKSYKQKCVQADNPG